MEAAQQEAQRRLLEGIDLDKLPIEASDFSGWSCEVNPSGPMLLPNLTPRGLLWFGVETKPREGLNPLLETTTLLSGLAQLGCQLGSLYHKRACDL